MCMFDLLGLRFMRVVRMIMGGEKYIMVKDSIDLH